MYLSRGIWKMEDGRQEMLKMAGVLSFETRMTHGRPQLSYKEILLKEDCIIGKRGYRVRGHEFHYSEKVNRAKNKNTLCSVFFVPGSNSDEGYRIKSTLASYIHIHFGSNPAIARTFVDFLRRF